MVKIKIERSTLEAALEGYKSMIRDIEVKMGEIILGLGIGIAKKNKPGPRPGTKRKGKKPGPKKGFKKTLAAGVKKVSNNVVGVPAGAKKKRKMSAAGRAAIQAAQKKRWDAKRNLGKTPKKHSPKVKKTKKTKKVQALPSEPTHTKAA